MICVIISPFIVDSPDTNLSQSPCLMNGRSSQLDPYNPPNNYQFFYASYNPSQQSKPYLELIFWVYQVVFVDYNFMCVW